VKYSTTSRLRDFNEDDSDVSSDENNSEVVSVKLTPLKTKEPCQVCISCMYTGQFCIKISRKTVSQFFRILNLLADFHN